MTTLSSYPSSLLNTLTTTICKTTNEILPPPRRTAIVNTLSAFHFHHPFLSTFLLAQLICSGIPIILFFLFASGVFLLSVASALIVAALVTGLWAAVALLVLVPVVVGAVVFGAVVWAWAWAGWLGWKMTRGYLGWDIEEKQNGVWNGIGESQNGNGKDEKGGVEGEEKAGKDAEVKGKKEPTNGGNPCEGKDERVAGDQLEI